MLLGGMCGSTKMNMEKIPPRYYSFLSRFVIFHLDDSGRLSIVGPKSGLGKSKCPDMFAPNYFRDTSSLKENIISKSQETGGDYIKNQYTYDIYI